MKNTGKAGSVAKRKGSVGTKTKSGKDGPIEAVPPFAHRTPTQLHASIYALKRG